MSYYQFNRPEILQKAKKERYSKEKTAEYYLKSKEAMKKSKNWYKNLSQEKKKDKIKDHQRKSIKSWLSMKKKDYKINNFCFCLSIKRMSEKKNTKIWLYQSY